MLPTSRFLACLTVGTASLTAFSAQADEARYNQISLRAEVNQQVARDRMEVTLYSEAQNQDPAKLAAQITQTLNTALGEARKAKGIDVSLGGRNSYPVYDEKGQTITGWRERAELRLESNDFPALSKLTGELLNNLSMGSMSFSVADATRKKSEDALIAQAIQAFKARAQLATQALGGKDYKLVSLNLNTSGYQAPVRLQAMMKSARADAAPEIEAGTSDITLSADGIIEVQMP